MGKINGERPPQTPAAAPTVCPQGTGEVLLCSPKIISSVSHNFLFVDSRSFSQPLSVFPKLIASRYTRKKVAVCICLLYSNPFYQIHFATDKQTRTDGQWRDIIAVHVTWGRAIKNKQSHGHLSPLILASFHRTNPERGLTTSTGSGLTKCSPVTHIKYLQFGPDNFQTNPTSLRKHPCFSLWTSAGFTVYHSAIKVQTRPNIAWQLSGREAVFCTVCCRCLFASSGKDIQAARA